jgi:hypothetical protein
MAKRTRIVKAGRLDFLDGAAHPIAFKLEQAHGQTGPDQIEILLSV